MYNIYKQTGDGLHLVAENVDYRTTEVYRECCKNVVVKDSANRIELPSDETLTELYGVSDTRMMESASILFACIGAGALLLILALAIQL